ncbi:MAG: Six-hairpin glycosidase-like protein [Olpidium bornovanus]|uniref:Six-hairpin glycosidase-like protein n=1 Tax=Olpidium bornovanus TaxID=278681 RepID=A0A8H7ZXA3_9FUNG|nr:MAG: Six-hairpin glycosidase-like protein [Olpidium bornovanus]
MDRRGSRPPRSRRFEKEKDIPAQNLGDGARLPGMEGEAQGYALLISCLAGVQQDFDSFLRYVDMFVNAKGLMGWQRRSIRPAGTNCRLSKWTTTASSGLPATAARTAPATDGDLDIAYALFLAARKWGNQAYRFRALGICKALWDHCVNKELYSLRLGDWVEPASNQDKLTRSSDFLLTPLNAFYHEDAERSAGWLHVLNTSIEILRGVAGQQPTGLVPDFIEHRHGRWRAATGQVLETPHDGDFYWNACRVPWRLGAAAMIALARSSIVRLTLSAIPFCCGVFLTVVSQWIPCDGAH